VAVKNDVRFEAALVIHPRLKKG